MTPTGDQGPWITRPGTVRALRAAGIVALAALVAAGALVTRKPYFEFEAVFGFGALYGAGAAAGLVILAKALGALLRREEGYYDD